MVCADADGKCVREVFILIRGFCVVFHMFFFDERKVKERDSSNGHART